MDKSFLTTVDLPTPEGPDMTTNKPRLPAPPRRGLLARLGINCNIITKSVDFDKLV
jgi:hypothetical protein